MGHSIVYCDKCGQLLKEEDFRQGKAFTQDNRSYCAACRPSSLNLAAPPAPSKISSSRIPKQPANESSRIAKQPGHVSARIPLQAPAPPPPAPATSEDAKSRTLYIGAAVGIVVLCVIIAMATGGKEKPRVAEKEPEQAVVTVKSLPAGETMTPEARRAEEAARAACVKAYGVPETDKAARWRAFEEALAASQGTSYAAEADGQLKKIRRQFEDERAAIESRMQDLMAREQFRSAVELWEAELKRWNVAEWTRPVNNRILELRAEFERRIGVMREAAAEARRRGDDAEVKRIRFRVASWGLAGYAEQVDRAVAEAVPVKVDPPPDAGNAAARALEAYRAKWKALLAPAASRDFAEAVKAMEKLAAETKDEAKKEAAEDLENLKLAAALLQETAPLLPKLAKGQRVAISYWDPSGSLAKVEEAVLKIDAHRVEMRAGDGGMVIPLGEVAAATLADLARTKAPRAAVVACLLEGDAEGAQRFRGEPFPMINEKYAEAAKEALDRRAVDEREKAARSLFYEAERTYFDFGEMAGAIGRYKALLAEHAGTAFVRRNRGAIAARAEGGLKDFFYQHGDLLVTSGFKLGKYGKIEGAWVSQQDSDAAKMKDAFVELQFSAGPDGEYRVWVLAGGCCQEVFTFGYQGTDLMGPDPANPKEKVPLEPGSGVWGTHKSTNSSLKKTHAQHTGPKNPERFDWISLGAFKYPAAGPKILRILTNQKGFAVAGAAVITSRPGAPRDLDFKEFEKWRAETPGASLKQGGVVTGSILREVWRGVGGGGIGELMNHPAFKEDKPTEQGLVAQFEGPQDWADDYGTRIRGYVHPPASGVYVFWLSSDDQGELWLSSDEDPKNKERIAWTPDWTGPREFTKHTVQQSKPIELKAGRRYYVEALQKEGGGGDHLCVKWKLPNGQEELPIPGNRLSPFAPPKK